MLEYRILLKSKVRVIKFLELYLCLGPLFLHSLWRTTSIWLHFFDLGKLLNQETKFIKLIS